VVALGIEDLQPGAADRHQQTSLVVDMHSKNIVFRQRLPVLCSRVVHIAGDLAGVRFQSLQTAGPSAQPYVAVTIFGDGQYRIGTQSGGVGGIVAEVLEGVSVWIEAVHSIAVRPYPDMALAIFEHAGNIVKAQGVIGIEAVTEGAKFL